MSRKKLTLADLTVGNESLGSKGLLLEGDDNTKVTIDQTIEVETAAAEEAEAAVATEEAVVASEDAVEDTEEGAELYARLDHILLNTSTYGITRSSAHALNHGNELYDSVKSLPALESLPMTASPKDVNSMLVTDHFKASSNTMRNWIHNRANATTAIVDRMVDHVVNTLEAQVNKSSNITLGLAGAALDDDKVATTNFNGMYAGDVDNIALVLPNLMSDLISFDYSSGATFTSQYLDQLGVTYSDEGVLNTTALRGTLRGGTLNASASGWDLAKASSTESMDLLFGAAKMLPEAAANFKAALSRLEAEADEAIAEDAASEEVTTEEAVELRGKLHKRIASITSTQEVMNLACRVLLNVSKQHLNGQRAAYACRAV